MTYLAKATSVRSDSSDPMQTGLDDGETVSTETDAARIDDVIQACWLRIDDFWPLGLSVGDQKLVDLEECLHVAACEVEYGVVLRVLAAYEERARELAANHGVTVAQATHARAGDSAEREAV
jgi:hypothetical protein